MNILRPFALHFIALLALGSFFACDDGGSSGAAARSCSTNADCGQGQLCKFQDFVEPPGFRLSAPPGVDCGASCGDISAQCPEIPQAQCLAICNGASDACFGCLAAAAGDHVAD